MSDFSDSDPVLTEDEEIEKVLQTIQSGYCVGEESATGEVVGLWNVEITSFLDLENNILQKLLCKTELDDGPRVVIVGTQQDREPAKLQRRVYAVVSMES